MESKNIAPIIPTQVYVPAEALLRGRKKDSKSADIQKQWSEFLANVKQHGVIQSILVVEHNDPDHPEYKYRLIDGLQRLTAAIDAGLTTIPANIAENANMVHSIIANMFSFATTPKEYGDAVRLLIEQGLTIAAVCEKLNKSPATIYKWLHIAELPDDIRERIYAGDLSMQNAEHVLARRGLTDEEKTDMLRKTDKTETLDSVKARAEKALSDKRTAGLVKTVSLKAPEAPKEAFSAKRMEEVSKMARTQYEVRGEESPFLMMLCAVLDYVYQISNDNPLSEVKQ